MYREDLKRKLLDLITLKGKFTLKSGKETDYYLDKFLFESDPFWLREVTKHLVSCITHNFDIIAGSELGGVSLVTALSLKLNKPCVFVRHRPKEYGTCKQIEGTNVCGKYVLYIDDIVTTGSSIVNGIDVLKKAGALLVGAYCVIKRTDKIFSDNNIKLQSLL